MSRGLSPGIRGRILELVGNGMRQQDVAFELGLSPGQVAGICFRARKAKGYVPQRRIKGPRSMRERAALTLTPTPDPAAAVPSGPAGGPSTPSPVLILAAADHRQETGQARTFTAPARAQIVALGEIARPRTCQWIDGEPSADDACKCGRPTIPGFSYCAPHVARAYQPRRERNEDAAPASIDEWNRRRAERLDAVIGAEA